MDIIKQSLLKSWNITTNGVFNRTQRFYTIYINRTKLQEFLVNLLKISLLWRRKTFENKRYALLCLLGGLVGGIIGYIIGAINWEKLFNYAQFANFKVVLYTTIVASLINVILTVYLFIVQNASLHYKAKIDANISDDLADTYENKSYTKSLKVRFIYTMQLIVAFIAILILVIGNASENHIALIIIPFIITIVSSIMIGIFYRKFDARHPKLGEKHYTEKAFNIMDEGERYITLVSLYKVHQLNIVLLL